MSETHQTKTESGSSTVWQVIGRLFAAAQL